MASNDRPTRAVAPALAAWARILGADSVLSDESTLDHYARSTALPPNRPLAVLYPASTEQVSQIVRAANEHGVPLHAISRGKNWGYGDAWAPGERQVIVDMRRMNRIHEVNERLGYAVIESGVTQNQLQSHLQQNGIKLWIDSTGAGLEASLVGNTLDRGFGHTPYGDHFLSACGMEVVLGDGRVLHTGFGHFQNAKATHVYRYGVGPFLDGIFAQSNFGIVTRIGLWLMPVPEDFCAFFCLTQEEKDLPHLIDTLAHLRMQGVLRTAVHVGNDLRIFSSRGRYPWELTGGQTPLPAEIRRTLRRRYSVGAWNVGSAVYGPRRTVAAARKEIASALRRYKPVFLNDRRLALAQRIVGLANRVGLLRGLGERLESVKPVYGLLKGIPTDEPLRGVSWRVRDPDPGVPVDPLDCHAGLMWVSPVIPATGVAADDLMALIEPIYARHRFETLITFTMITERALCCVTNIAFDRRVEEEAQAARTCYDELMSALLDRGYIPYRAGPGGMQKLGRHPSVFWDVTRQIKQTLDPRHILSPGRYVPEG
jgi:4-cresol dehydrogenase (hydroxylating) flavoprotein subunit